MEVKANGVVTDIKNWAVKPITSDMDFMDVVLTTILIATVAFLWTRILAQITD